jgi:hypothetical protein
VVQVVTDKRELPDLLGRFGVRDIPEGISHFGDRSRAYVKVQDGCMLRCSYCIIPKVRPQLTSRPIEPILDEVRRLVANGYREIVLTGVHLGHYGVDWNWHKPKSDWIAIVRSRAADRRNRRRLPHSSVQHRSDRSDARAAGESWLPIPRRSARTCTSACRAAPMRSCAGCGGAGRLDCSSTAAAWPPSCSTNRP